MSDPHEAPELNETTTFTLAELLESTRMALATTEARRVEAEAVATLANKQRDAMVTALGACVCPIAVMAAHISVKPYKELSAELQRQIVDADAAMQVCSDQLAGKVQQ